ncbi:MAG TPA: hypothetical protein VGR82_01180 [Methylomirabilota bacterium]|nr:hypothetical protein [Methylomirabilota bacterium]
MATLVERDHAEPAGERGNYTIEPVGVGRATMQEAEGRRPGPARVHEMQANAVDGLGAVRGDVATQWLTAHSA